MKKNASIQERQKEVIGDRLKEERERLGYSRDAFAALGGMSGRAQVEWEKGTALPNAKFLAVIAEAGADVQYILTGVESVGIAPIPAQAKSASDKTIEARPGSVGARADASELSKNNSDVWLSAGALAELRLDGYPTSERRMRDLVERERWAHRDVPSQGGKKGLKREYLPPEKALRLMDTQGKAPLAIPSAAKDGLNSDMNLKGRQAAYGTESPGNAAVNLALLEDSIKQVEALAFARRLSLPPEKKARLITLIYDYCLNKGQGWADQATVARFVDLFN